MEYVISPSSHPDDLLFIQSLRQCRMARSLFRNQVYEPLSDSCLCPTASTFYSAIPWMQECSSELFELMKVDELQYFKQFLSGESVPIEVYYFVGNSCASHHKRHSWLFKQTIHCVDYEMRCVCIAFRNLDVVLEIHFTRTETFDNQITFKVYLQCRYESNQRRLQIVLDSMIISRSLSHSLINLLHGVQLGRRGLSTVSITTSKPGHAS
jgi:hypothetical protein